MKRKLLWVSMGYLVVLSLVIIACAPAAAPSIQTTTAPTTTAPTTTAPITTSPTTVSPSQDKPIYGGAIVYSRRTDTRGFDQVYNGVGWENSQFATNDHLLIGDWARGAAGTNEFDFSIQGGWAAQGVFNDTGSVAESWEVPNDKTIIFHIRKGVRFQDKPPVNGRELDANDVAFSIQYMYLNPKFPQAYNVIAAPGALKLLSATATDKWTVEVKMEGLAWAFFEDLAVKGVHLVAKESIDKYGDLKDWRNALGSGGFILTDYVPASSFTFVKNPNYWMKNPVGPGKGDQLPYVDTVKWLVITDKSTELAALRTGKIDTIVEPGEVYQDYVSVKGTNPDMRSQEVLGASMPAVGPMYNSTDPTAVPLQNQRVRWALSMALDRETMVRDYYMGAATNYILFFPVKSPYSTTFDQKAEILEKVFGMKPEDAAMVKKVWEYHPDEAKKILAEEGYPNGFRTKVLTPPTDVDVLSIYAAYWDKVNVKLDLEIKEATVFSSVRDSKTYPGLVSTPAHMAVTNPAKWVILGQPDQKGVFPLANYWNLVHPVIADYQKRTDAVYGDLEASGKLFRELDAWTAWYMHTIWTPVPTTYMMWQPWLKNYYGFNTVGFRSHYAAFLFAWVDQDLKKKMGK